MGYSLISNAAAMSSAVWSGLLRQKVSTSCAGTRQRWPSLASMRQHDACTQRLQLSAMSLLSVNSSAELPVYAYDDEILIACFSCRFP
jgi:hypothetical protein